MKQLPKIVQQRLRATAKPGVHPDPDLLTAFAEKSLNDRERAQVLQHLAQCADCRNVVSLAMPEMWAPSPIPQGSRWLTWTVLRWGALAACVVVVSTAVTLHYERRQSVEPTVAEKAPAPVPSATVTLERRASNEPAQKLAAKIAPPAPFPSDRDFKAVGKLAKQRQDMDVRSAAGAAAINGLETGRVERRRLENRGQAAEPERSLELADNQRANADALKSMEKPSALPTGGPVRAVPSAPPPPPSAKSKTADTEAHAEEGNENFNYAAKGSSEMVTVQGESRPVEAAQATVGQAKDESDKKVQKRAGAGLRELPLVSRNISDLSALNKITPSWTVSPEGAVQRSLDSGKTWQTIPVASHVVFRALAANDFDIWVGGSAGALYHSSDAGQHWTQIKPMADGKALTADIISVEFTDAQHGKLITDSHETWITGDGGASWHRN